MPGPIRPAVGGDLAGVTACVDAAFAPYVTRIGKPPAPMLADYGALIDAGRVHLLEDQGAIAGVIVVEARTDQLFVDVVAIAPDRQRTGIGQALMAFAAARARARGLAEIALYTHELMTDALAFYRALGYREVARRHEDGYARVYLAQPIETDS